MAQSPGVHIMIMIGALPVDPKRMHACNHPNTMPICTVTTIRLFTDIAIVHLEQQNNTLTIIVIMGRWGGDS